MRTRSLIFTRMIGSLGLLASLGASIPAHAKVNAVELTQKSAETQIRRLIEPVLDKYCHDSCRLMSIRVTVDLAVNDEIAPGFDDIELKKGEIAPSSANIKILIDDKVGPISKTKLTDLLQQYLDTLDYPATIETQIAHFPLPQGIESKIAELNDRIAKQFTATTTELLNQFCPEQCILTDLSVQTDPINSEEAQYGPSGEFLQEGEAAVRIKSIGATIVLDDSLNKEEQNNILEMVKLKTNGFKHVNLHSKVMKLPHPTGIAGKGRGGLRGLSEIQDSSSESKNSESKSNSSSSEQSNRSEKNSSESTKHEKFERVEKIERVENGDAVQAELQKFKVFGLIFACSALALLLFIAVSNFRPTTITSPIQKVIESLADPTTASSAPGKAGAALASAAEDKGSLISKRYEIELLVEELTSIYAQHPRVAKQVFSRILTEEGVETTAECIYIFGEAIVVDMLRDPSLQSDLNELMEYYAKNTIELTEDKKLDLLRKLHNRTVAGKMVVLGNRSSNLFDFLAEMDGLQILELIRTESLTVKSIVLTQVDPQKRAVVYAQMEPEYRLQLLTELSRIDYLPRDYIFNVAAALKRKKKENPKLNTEALPGSEVLVSLLERTGQTIQKTVIKALENSNPDSARTVKSKLVSVDTLRYLRDGQLLEVILSLKHDELIQFLKGAPNEVRSTIFAKSPRDLIVELEEELSQLGAISRETYLGVERKLLNRMKIMANEGQINLIETNERMFGDDKRNLSFVQAGPSNGKSANHPMSADQTKTGPLRRAG